MMRAFFAIWARERGGAQGGRVRARVESSRYTLSLTDAPKREAKLGDRRINKTDEKILMLVYILKYRTPWY